MKIEKTINNPLDNEHVIDVYPPLQTGSQSHWQRRLKFFTGRSLTDLALKREQSYRAGYLAMRGQMMSAGVKSGLDVILGQEELVWIEDSFPPGASRLTEDENQWWNWVASNPVSFSGPLALQSGLVAEEHQDGFSGATVPMKIVAGDLLIAYVYLDPENPPSEIMLQWHDPEGDGSWEHRAYWGANNINLGVDGTASRYRLGDLPASGQWVRLEILAQQLGLLGSEVDGIIFSLDGGRATWDHIGKASTFYHLTPGTGITVQGEDVFIPKDWRVTIGEIAVYTPVNILTSLGGDSEASDGDIPQNSNLSSQRTLSPRNLGKPLQALIEEGLAAQLPPVGILLLQPIVAELVGEFDPSDPCELDPQNYAFEDWQLVDSCRLILYSWPVEWLNLPEVGGDLSDPKILALWRNRLAHAIFSREKANSPQQIMPWESVGVPIALIGFDDNWKPLFSDRHAVVRQGGKPKQRSPLIANVGNPFLWQAQIQQFAEQLTEMNLENLTELAPCFRYLPPVGILPKNAIEARAGKDHFFPPAYGVQAAPIPSDQIELVVEASASLRPFDTFKTDESEQVQVLVPVPSQWYEPQLLKVEKVDPIFQKTINDLLPQRAELLYRRQLVRRRLAAIIKTITGKLPEFQDPEQVEEETIHSIPFSSTRVLEGTGLYLFKGATATLSIATGDKLTVYVFLDPDNPPSRLEVWWLMDNSLIRRAYWGIRDLDVTTSRYMGVLPALGQWVQLTVPANLLNLQGTTVYGMAVEAEDGRLAWGHAGKAGSTPGSDIVWVGNELPTGAQTGDNQGWEWISAREKLEILAESEEEIAARQIPFASTQALIPEVVSVSQAIYFISDAVEQLSVSPNDSLTAYVYLDSNNLPNRLELWWIVGDGRLSRRLRQAYWGELDIDNNSNRYMGPLPISGRWVRLEVPVSLLGLAADTAIVGMAFSADGLVAWAHAGKSTAGAPPEDDTVWVGNELPAGSRIVRDDGWSWVELNPERTPFGEALPPPPEPIVEADYGTTIARGVRVVIAVEELKKNLKEKSPLDKDAIKLDKLDALKNKAVPLAALPVEIPSNLTNKIRYDSRRKLLIVQGILSQEERDRLKQLNDDRDYQEAIDMLFNAGQDAVQLEAILLRIPASLTGKIRYEAERQFLTIQGVMSLQEKKQLLALADGNFNADKEFKKVIELLYEQSQDNQDLEKLEELGLEKFIDFLQAKIDSADDKIDLGFVQIQTNMYRIRQYILGTDAASRLAISPTLAEIAQRKSAAVTEKELSDYIAQIKGKKVEPIEDRSVTVSSSTASVTESVPPPADATISRVEISGAESSSLFSRIEASSTARLFEVSQIEPVIGQPVKPVEKVQKQSPIVGEVPRILTVSERLQEPAPKITRAYSLAGRRDIVTSLSDVGIFKGLEVPGLEKVTFSQLKNSSVRAEIVAEIESGASEDTVEDDELTYFSSAVKALDRTAAALRLAERRTQEYRDIIDLCQEVLDKLDPPLNQANQRLSAIADELAETRHDIAVARSLLGEEQARVESINQRRDRIISEHVSFLVFHRPRFVGSGVDVPSRPLDSGLVEAPVPACLRQHRALPPELEEAIELLREAPMKWFPKLSLLLKQLDRIETITKAISIAQVNAKIQSPVQFVLTQAIEKKPNFGQAIQRVFAAQQQVVTQYRQQTVQFDTNNLVSQSWTQVRDRAQELLSWGDLIEGRHQRNRVAQEAARQFENMARILACLYSNFAEVLPAIRLDWAERLSQYDRPVNLRNLASLPRWREIERLERQEIQALVDWLYQQVDPQQSEAVALMSDLIRICILLASHAPVNQIIVGRVARATTTLNPGTRVDLTVATSQVRVGMEVLMYGTDNTVVAKGVVENLATGLAETRVVKTFKPNQQLSENARVQLTEPGVFEGSPLTSGISGIKITSFK